MSSLAVSYRPSTPGQTAAKLRVPGRGAGEGLGCWRKERAGLVVGIPLGSGGQGAAPQPVEDMPVEALGRRLASGH